MSDDENDFLDNNWDNDGYDDVSFFPGNLEGNKTTMKILLGDVYVVYPGQSEILVDNNVLVGNI